MLIKDPVHCNEHRGSGLVALEYKSLLKVCIEDQSFLSYVKEVTIKLYLDCVNSLNLL